MNDIYTAHVDGVATESDVALLDPRAGYVTLVNTYEVDPDRSDELLAFLIASTRSTLRYVPGFVSANLHVSLDRTRLVNYAQWQSRDSIAAARENSNVVALMQEQSTIASSFAPVAYELRASIPAAR